jgi:hypothetical protein
MIIGIDWVIVCNLVALIGGVVMGASLARPGHYSNSRNR